MSKKSHIEAVNSSRIAEKLYRLEYEIEEDFRTIVEDGDAPEEVLTLYRHLMAFSRIMRDMMRMKKNELVSPPRINDAVPQPEIMEF